MLTHNLRTDVHSSFLRNCPDLGATKLSLSRWMDKQAVVHPDSGLELSATKKGALELRKDVGEA